jgi:hypothetical protein
LRQRGEIQMAHGIYTRALAFAEEASRQAVLAADISDADQGDAACGPRVGSCGVKRGPRTRPWKRPLPAGGPDTPTTERADCMVVLADLLLEAGVLTSDRDTSSLLEEAAEIYRELGATDRGRPAVAPPQGDVAGRRCAAAAVVP